MIWVLVGFGLLAVMGGVYWRARRRRRPRLISFVGLVQSPVAFDPAVLARAAGKAWDADLGDGSGEGADGFVVGVGPMATLVHDGRMFLVNAIPNPYTEDKDKVAESIIDLRIRKLFREHTAWFSCDALGVDRTTPADEVRDWYRRLGRLFAELLDDNCLLIHLPDSSLSYPINEDTQAALRSDDPLRELQESLTVPLIEVAGDDPIMVRAVAGAREAWPEFVAAFDASAGENFSLKAPVRRGDDTEFIWIRVTSIEGGRVYGTLGNDPAHLPGLKLGSKVSVPVEELNDWIYVDPKGNMKGGFTIEAVKQAADRKRKRT